LAIPNKNQSQDFTKKHSDSANLHQSAIWNFVEKSYFTDKCYRIAKLGEEISNHGQKYCDQKITTKTSLAMNFDPDLSKTLNFCNNLKEN